MASSISSRGRAQAEAESFVAPARARWNWIHGRRTDLTWYIGSASVGWVYLALVLVAGRGLSDPMRDPFYVWSWGDLTIPLTLGLVVMASWAVLIDAPHVWATLARTFLDPDEWRERRSVLLASGAWFALGPAAILGPYLLASVVPMSRGALDLPAHAFLAFFRLWAYYHVVRQHWGFLVLYKRGNDDFGDPVENRADTWFFNAALYLPLAVFVTAPWFAATGMPSLGLDRLYLGGRSLAAWLHAPVMFAYPVVVAAYLAFQIRRHRGGHPRNGPKLLFLLSIVPLHLVVFLHPLLALFVVPIVTVGHNLQYHRIVWSFGRNKYVRSESERYRWARSAFRSAPLYWVLGLAFTLALYQGPWVEIVQSWLGGAIDASVAPALALIAGLESAEGAGLGGRVAAALFLGWAMQHYYLDSKIWRLRKDPRLGAYLRGGS